MESSGQEQETQGNETLMQRPETNTSFWGLAGEVYKGYAPLESAES